MADCPSLLQFAEELKNERHNWFQLGVYFGAEYGDLKTIEADNSADCEKCLYGLYEFLSSSGKLKSWKDVSSAVLSMGNNTLADLIHSKYIGNNKSFPDSNTEDNGNNHSDNDQICFHSDEEELENTTEAEYIHVHQDIVTEFKSIKRHFSGVVLKTKQAIERQNLHDIQMIILDQCKLKPLKEASIEQLFNRLGAHYCFMNYEILECLVQVLLGVEQHKQIFHEYSARLQQFQESATVTDLMHLINDHKQENTRRSSKLVKLKVEEYWGKVTLSDFRKMALLIFRKTFKRGVRLTVSPGCVSVSWEVFDVENESSSIYIPFSSDFLEAIGIIFIEINGKLIFRSSFVEECVDHESAYQRASKLQNVGGMCALLLLNQRLIASKQTANSSNMIISNLHIRDAFTGFSLLHYACILNLVEVVKLLLEIGLSPDVVDSSGWTPLMFACSRNSTEIIDLLLQANADVDIRSTDGRTAAIIACEFDNEAVSLLLYKRGAKLHYVNQQKVITPLMVASSKGHRSLVSFFLEQYLGVDQPSENGWTALLFACWEGNDAIVDLLVQNKASVNATSTAGCSSLMLASQNGHLNVVNILVQNGAIVNHTDYKGMSALVLACQNGHDSIVACLLQSRANPNVVLDDGTTPLIMAIEQGNFDIVQLLVAAEADINVHLKYQIKNYPVPEDELTPLMVAYLNRHFKILLFLIAVNADVNAATTRLGVTLLHIICSMWGEYEIAFLLLHNGAYPNIQYLNGTTPLIIAYEMSYFKLFSLLLEKNGNPNSLNRYGEPLLYMASADGNHSIVSSLLQHGADPNQVVISNHYSPLIVASAKGHIKIVETLLKANVLIDHRTLHGSTALYKACEQGHAVVVEMLLKQGANPNYLSKVEGIVKLSPLAIAYQNGHFCLIPPLLEVNANPNTYNIHLEPLIYTVSADNNQPVLLWLLKYGVDPNLVEAKNHVTSLIIASAKGHKKIVETLLEENVQINRRALDGSTALYRACENGHFDVVEMLLIKGANPNVPDKSMPNISPLTIVYQNGYVSLIPLLLQANADPNTYNVHFEPLIYTVCCDNNQTLLYWLLEYGANPNLVELKNQCSPLIVASANGYLEIVRTLLQTYEVTINHQDSNNATALYKACENGHSAVVEMLLMNGADPNIRYKSRGIYLSPLSISYLNKHYDLIPLLLNANANPDTYDSVGNPLLCLACEDENVTVVSLLLDFGANTSLVSIQNRFTSLIIASVLGHERIVEMLLQNVPESHGGIDQVAFGGSTALHKACEHGHGKIVRMLLNEGANPNIMSQYNGFPLTIAYQNGHFDLIPLLLKAKANPDLCSLQFQKPLIYSASADNNQTVLSCLLQYGADPNCIDISSWSPLIIASAKGHKEIVETLLKNGKVPIKVNYQTETRATALHCACRYGHRDIVEILIENGAIPNLADVYGLTPPVIAILCGFSEVVSVVEKSQQEACFAKNFKKPEQLRKHFLIATKKLSTFQTEPSLKTYSNTETDTGYSSGSSGWFDGDGSEYTLHGLHFKYQNQHRLLYSIGLF